ncbi:Hypothetical predicted protein [Pelobates cultripes]|uniref:Transmembrane protein 232 n=1 Tax=Pelobates cultripes TaxID=61616 RepID=A0AAD1SCD4_PELCU|nr:Hypothetical predicted protein [Pelobates cultripes]
MPIVKVSLVQKFGIISTTHHLELQRRHLEKMEAIKNKSSVHGNPLEVTEEFIKQFNNAKDQDEEEHLLDTARKILQRCKRRSGLNSRGSGSHINLPLAWTELIFLAQCKGKIQEDALDILLTSMDIAHIDKEHVPLLFFIAESVLYRLCFDVIDKKCLFSNEVKFSKLGFLTFLRLYIFHLTGQLQAFEEQKEKLSLYLKALPSCEPSYQPCPNVLFFIRVMLKVGEIVCAISPPSQTQTSLQTPSESADILNEGMASEDINPFVWHCLLIWQHVQRNKVHLCEVIDHLFLIKRGLHQNNWLDSLVGLLILGEAAKLDILCLKALMELAKDLILYCNRLPEQNSSFSPVCVSPWPWEVVCAFSMVLSDICLHGTTSEIQKYAFTGFQDESTDNTDIKEASLHGMLNVDMEQEARDQTKWIIHYCAVYNLAKICHELLGDSSRDGLRNAIWRALYKHRNNKKDGSTLHAVKLAEAEVNGPENPFISGSAKTSSPCMSLAFCQYVGYRLASALTQKFLPPAVPYIPVQRKPVPKLHLKTPVWKEHAMKRKPEELSLRNDFSFNEQVSSTHPHFVTRTNLNLWKVIEDQWRKEVKIKTEEDEYNMEVEEQEKKTKEEKHFKEIMKKREQKLNKTSKPYELPVTNKDTQ